MGNKKWVQHISGQGEKWEVDDCNSSQWVCIDPLNKLYKIRLPKSEYRECDPPEQWEDVTEQVDYCGNLAFSHRNACRIGDVIVTDDKGYRFRKVDRYWHGVLSPAFIVERKKSC